MSRDAKIEIDFADGTFPFRLGWGELVELQEKTDVGPYVVLHRLHSHHWKMEDITNVIRLGLIGGGMTPADALRKVRTYVEARPPLENHPVAAAVLAAGLLGAPEEPVGEPVAPAREAE
ncbi:MAG: gene transfer agent family protein [Shinella sp.]|nr:gene transfer agent family protein [Shinella sp.]